MKCCAPEVLVVDHCHRPPPPTLAPNSLFPPFPTSIHLLSRTGLFVCLCLATVLDTVNVCRQAYGRESGKAHWTIELAAAAAVSGGRAARSSAVGHLLAFRCFAFLSLLVTTATTTAILSLCLPKESTPPFLCSLAADSVGY